MTNLKSLRCEVAVDSLESAIIARDCGIDRVELCADLDSGGLTPSLGMTELVCQRLDMPVHVMLRPRRGDFLYTSAEFDIMRRDLTRLRAAGAQGVVFGILDAGGSIDRERCQALIAAARPLRVTFHRAFDMCREPLKALEQLIALGADTVLTSGQQANAEAGIPLLKKLVAQARGRIDIMPGAGINAGNIRRIAAESGAGWLHFSAREAVEGPMLYRNARARMGAEGSEFRRSYASAARIRGMLAALD